MDLHCSDVVEHNHHLAGNASISATTPFTLDADGVPCDTATQTMMDDCLQKMVHIKNDRAPVFLCSKDRDEMFKHFNAHGTPFLCAPVDGNTSSSERYHLVQLYHIINAEDAVATIYDANGYAMDKCLIQANDLFCLEREWSICLDACRSEGPLPSCSRHYACSYPMVEC